MPELPEVETVARDVRPLLTGRRLLGVRAGPHKLRKPWSAAWEPLVVGRRVKGVRRRGKWIVLDLDDGARLVVHLGMTGQLRVHAPADPVEPHTHLVFTVEGGGELRFRDVRRFGGVTHFADEAALDAFFAAAGLGPEPFDLEPADWRQRLSSTKRNVKATLLDQGVVAACTRPGPPTVCPAPRPSGCARPSPPCWGGPSACGAPASAITSAAPACGASSRRSSASTDGPARRARAAARRSSASAWRAAPRTFARAARRRVHHKDTKSTKKSRTGRPSRTDKGRPSSPSPSFLPFLFSVCFVSLW